LEFTSGFHFETARLIYFGIIPIIFSGMAAAIILSFRKRRRVPNPAHLLERYLGINWDFHILLFFMLLGISFCIICPDFFDWRTRRVNAEIYHAIVTSDVNFLNRYINKDNVNRFLFVANEPYYYPPPLHLAAQQGKLKLVKYFLGKGADPKRRAAHGTALHYACLSKRSNAAIVEYLIQHDTDTNALNFDGKTPLDFAISKKIKKCLVKHGAKTAEELTQAPAFPSIN
jgi:hypothetical protein